MKLSEIKKSRPGKGIETFTKFGPWAGDGPDLDVADVEVKFVYTGPSHTDHPYGEGSAREYHPEEVELESVKLVKDTDRFNEDGEVSGQLKAGTDLMDQKWWKGSYGDDLIDLILKRIKN